MSERWEPTTDPVRPHPPNARALSTSQWPLGEERVIGRRLYARCEGCGKIIRRKPFFDYAHLCAVFR